MNIQNVAELANQLQVLGFQDTGSLLLKRICFNPENFYLQLRVNKDKVFMQFSLYFERLQKNDSYILRYYDVTLQKENGISTLPVDGINPVDLEKQMTAIDWKKAFSLDEKKLWNPNDKSIWETELKISAIVESLSVLEKSEQGKPIASSLKQKFWSDISHQGLVNTNIAVKNKTDVYQRFYISEDAGGITTDEAYRFLQNKWMEKQMQVKRKKQELIDSSYTGEEPQGSSGSGLLKKRRVGSSTKNKRTRISQY